MSDRTELVTDVEWNRYRRKPYGEIDILNMYRSKNIDKIPEEIQTIGTHYLESIMTISPIKSRQVATVAMATAAMLDSIDNR